MIKFKGKKLVSRYIKYNIVGTIGFGLGAAIYVFLFPIFGEWTYVISSLAGGFFQFSLISILNTTIRGQIFESHKTP